MTTNQLPVDRPLADSADGRITADTAFCGGRWPASLLAEMEAARVG